MARTRAKYLDSLRGCADALSAGITGWLQRPHKITDPGWSEAVVDLLAAYMVGNGATVQQAPVETRATRVLAPVKP